MDCSWQSENIEILKIGCLWAFLWYPYVQSCHFGSSGEYVYQDFGIQMLNFLRREFHYIKKTSSISGTLGRVQGENGTQKREMGGRDVGEVSHIVGS